MRPGDELDVDWTLHKEWGEECRLREIRNELIRKQLEAGLTVAYRPLVGLGRQFRSGGGAAVRAACSV